MPVEDQTESYPGDLPDFGATSFAPPLEQEAPVEGLPVTEATVEAESKPKLPEFSPRHREPLDGLLYTGRLIRDFSWANHEFRIKTLDSDDHLTVGTLSKPWVGTTAENRAWVMAQVALCTIAVDGKKVAVPIAEYEDPAEAQFQWARKQYPWTIDAIFAHLTDLEAEAQQVIQQMEKA